jgi:hypothetical protein
MDCHQIDRLLILNEGNIYDIFNDLDDALWLSYFLL